MQQDPSNDNDSETQTKTNHLHFHSNPQKQKPTDPHEKTSKTSLKEPVEIINKKLEQLHS